MNRDERLQMFIKEFKALCIKYNVRIELDDSFCPACVIPEEEVRETDGEYPYIPTDWDEV
jgi:hypothetical protein